MYDWDLLAAYLAVVRTGSLSSAARKLGLSHPTVRQRIERLEARVGGPLFTRSMSGLVPLEGHEALTAEAEAMEAAAHAFARHASADPRALSGRVRISAPSVFAVERIPPALAGLRYDHPGIEIELAVTNAVEDLLRRDADIAVRLTEPQQQALVARKVEPVRLGFYAARGRMADLVEGWDFHMLCESGLIIGQDRLRTIEASLIRLNMPVPSRFALRTDDDLAQLAAIRAGVGVGICQSAIAEAEGFVPVSREVSTELPVWLVAHEGQIGVPRVRAVFDRLIAELAQAHPRSAISEV